MAKKSALILIDLQNDFCPGGRLAIPEGDAVIADANRLQAHFNLIIATQDWHPHDHMSFASNHPGKQIGDEFIQEAIPQLLWPNHCEQGSRGAAFHPQLHTQKINKIVKKGTDKTIDSYSAFFDNAHLHSTGLEAYLQHEKVTDVYIMGLATEYCVKYSALDAVQLGFNVFVIADACRGVEAQPGDSDKAFAEMRAVGVKLIHTTDILSANR